MTKHTRNLRTAHRILNVTIFTTQQRLNTARRQIPNRFHPFSTNLHARYAIAPIIHQY